MKKLFLHDVRVWGSAGLLLLVACTQPSVGRSLTGAPAEAVVSTAQAAAVDSCAANAQVAVDFINQYVRHLAANDAAAVPEETVAWLKKNPRVDADLARGYAATDLLEGDPILDAQDYPETFVLGGCPGAPGLVLVKGVGEPALMVRVRVETVGSQRKVVGVGRLNMADVAKH